jgi:single-stranded DNA-binding protein
MNRHPEKGDTDMSTATSTAKTTVFGSLAGDPTERFTAEKTGTQMVPDPAVPGRMVAKKFRIPGRPYIKLSLLRQGDRRTIDCVVWDPYDRTSVEEAHRARKGDRVALVGRFETYTQTTDGKPTRRTTFVVEEFHFVGAPR